jgi:hypothetical protein
MYGFSGSPANGTGESYGAMIVAANSDTGLQIAGGYSNDDLYFRGWSGSGATYYAWRRILHAGNFSTYAAPASHTHSYLPLTGGTLSGALDVAAGLKQDGFTILNGSDTWIRTSGATGWYSATYSTGIYAEATGVVTVFNSGKLKVNNTSTTSILTAGGLQVGTHIGVGVAPSTSYDIYANGGSEYGIRAYGSTMGGRFEDSGGTATAYCAYGSYGFYSGQSTYIGGGLGVGTTTIPSAGHIRATGDITAYYSDERLKDFEGTISNALEKVLSLNGYLYVENELAKSFGYDNDRRQVGVSAQELQKVLPEAVFRAPFDIEKDEDGNEYSKSGEDYLTVKYEKITPLLIEAVKEQQQLINQQRREIDELKVLVTQLLAKVS